MELELEGREDLGSIREHLPPVVIRSSSLFWPPKVVEALKTMSKGPQHSQLNSGHLLSLAISHISAQPLPHSASLGFSLFFDELISRADSAKWFGEVVPALANLLLRFPSLLESHYQNADHPLNGDKYGFKTGLRLLGPQEAGIVLLSQELIGALLACSFFCLFPVTNRGAKHLQTINFDSLFVTLYENYSEKQENKLKCILHYFERICSRMPAGFVSFERKVLSFENHPQHFCYPGADFWSRSGIRLCTFKVHSSGLIEDQSGKALEVDFANKYIGGGALNRGCLQEEIRFMISPELIAGMVFLPRMDDNEAIEIVGAERFSDYKGYASSFHFSGDYVDEKIVDSFGRHKTRIVAIDALCSPGRRQFSLKCLLREINKAFCGFFDKSKYNQYERLFHDHGFCGAQLDQEIKDPETIFKSSPLEAPSTSAETDKREPVNQDDRSSGKACRQCLAHEDDIGVVTGNWGCGAFGGDPELKAIIQWLAASQAQRPFISYYTFGIEELKFLDKVSRWILLHEWTVGDLWNMLVEYSFQRLREETDLGFFTWLLPSIICS
ncbi:PARG_cat domain-containing protein [Cephalotus follicularis]|uniref:poly(ADP-ribose) glycohydrolase n=1 Tax=Cephalotus follicularis TaxID=3775 RepID=A0A1Q3BGU7_CEPFO|nr:PARG_cat domain-containing protein [Cephalotus follicularis]